MVFGHNSGEILGYHNIIRLYSNFKVIVNNLGQFQTQIQLVDYGEFSILGK